MRFLLTVAWRNLWRQRRRSLLTASAISVAVGLCMATIAFQDGTYVQMRRVLVDQQIGHGQLSHVDYPSRQSMFDTISDGAAVLDRLEATNGVTAVAQRVYGQGLLGGEERSAGVLLVGIDPDREDRVSRVWKTIHTGEAFTTADHSIVMGEGLAKEVRVDLGDEVVVVSQGADGSIANDLFKVRGIFRSGNTQRDRSGAFVHFQDLQDLLVLPDQLHQISIVTADSNTIGETLKAIEADLQLSDRDEGSLRLQPWWEIDPQTAEMLGMQDGVAFFMLFIVFSVAALGVMNTMMMTVFERTRELGVLKALGLRPMDMVKLVVLESMCLASVACVGGLIIGGALDWYLATFGIDFSAGMSEGMTFNGITFDPVFYANIRPTPIVLTVICVYMVGVVSAIWPAWRAARLDPVAAMRET